MFRILTRVMKTTSVFASGLLMCVLMAPFLMFAVPFAWSQPFDSNNVSMYAWIKPGDVGASGGNDCWGYTSPTGREYALMGFNNKITIVEITDPANPVIVKSIGHSDSLWGDVKVYRDFCYVVNESGGGVQAIDLSNIDNGQAVLVSSFGPGASHNIAINEDSGFLYAVGSSLNGGRPVAYDLRTNPGNPTEAGRISSQQGSYIHDAQIVTMTDGREIMFGASEGRGVDIYDVSDKQNMVKLSRTTYPGLSYCHQMWTNDDHTILYVDDELDELNGYTQTTRTLVFDVSDLTNPVLVNTFTTGLPAIDHNLYYKDGFVYESNYTTGLHIFDARTDPINPTEVGFFDTYTESNGLGFAGAWNVYPFFPSGTVIVSDLDRGLFILDVSQAVPHDCLALDSTPIIAGQSSDFTVTGGTAGARVVVLYGFQTGQLLSCQQGDTWCVDFGIDIPISEVNKRIVVQGTFDGIGSFMQSRFIPNNASQKHVLMQAAESDTFPDPCMSNLLEVVIQ